MKIKTLDKIFKFIYIGFLAFLVTFVIYMMTVLLLSPKNDLKNRGFVGCTRVLVFNLGECESGQVSCVLKSFYSDTKCNSAVIADGFYEWLKGNQSTPWANYIYEPEWQENSENPYLGNPKADMQKIELEREFMKQKIEELENIKAKALKLNENVIISDPETEDEPESADETATENSADFEQNIDDEALIGEIQTADENAAKVKNPPAQKIKSDSDKIADKAKKEVLKQEK